MNHKIFTLTQSMKFNLLIIGLCSFFLHSFFGHKVHADTVRQVKPTSLTQAGQAVYHLQVGANNGSGFFVQPNLLVTNEHIISSAVWQGLDIQDIILINREGQQSPIKIKKVVAISYTWDMVFLETRSPSEFYLHVLKDPVKHNTKKPYFMLGYPMAGGFRALNTMGELSVQNGLISVAVDKEDDGQGLSGFSGGPMVDHNGHVAGIFTTFHSRRVAHFILSDYIWEVQNNPNYFCEDISLAECIELAMVRTQKKAQNGDVNAQFMLGFKQELNIHTYELALLDIEGQKGRSALNSLLEESKQQAHYWHNKAISQGHLHAGEHLAFMYANGIGVKLNFAKAFSLFSASSPYLLRSLHNMALMYCFGHGVEQDLKTGLHYMYMAAKKGYPLSISFLQNNGFDLNLLEED